MNNNSLNEKAKGKHSLSVVFPLLICVGALVACFLGRGCQKSKGHIGNDTMLIQKFHISPHECR